MKNKKRYIILGFILVIVFIVLISIPRKEKPITQIVPLNQNSIEDRAETEKEIIPSAKIAKENIPLISDVKSDELGNIKVSLEVLDKVYKSEVNEGSSVFDAMQKIKDTPENLFDFKYKETPGLGNFITEINGMKGTPGKYWIYYVNSEKATIGASQYVLKEGDIIRWSQEGL